MLDVLSLDLIFILEMNSDETSAYIKQKVVACLEVSEPGSRQLFCCSFLFFFQNKKKF